MLQLSQIRENREEVIRRLKVKNFANAEQAIDAIIEADNKRRAAQKNSDDIKSEVNNLARQVGELMRSGKKDEAEKIKSRSSELKEQDKKLESGLKDLEKALTDMLITVPNLPQSSVPEGKDSTANEVMREGGKKPEGKSLLPHWELTTKYDIIDFECGVKLTGAGFPVYKGKGARLQRALIAFFLDKATAAGYTEYQPPLLVNEASGFGTGQLPDKEGQMYHVSVDDFYLIPTAEVPLTNIFRDVIIPGETLPLKLCGYTPCFRREAGSYGKDVRGLNRLHQFDKVEIVQITYPEKSYGVHEEMLEHAEGLLRDLELPYRILKLCGGDMSFGSSLTYDLEVWSAAQQRWLEVSSVSNFETFQTNRLKCRYRDGKGKNQLAHSLNGSALALPRIVAALLENNQLEKSVRIPRALVSYCGFEEIS